MPPAGFEPTIPASERLQTYALHGAVTGIGSYSVKLLSYVALLADIRAIHRKFFILCGKDADVSLSKKRI
jgi:hypothetical protein